MKKFFALLGGIAIVLVFVLAYAEDAPLPMYPSDKMIQNDDLSNQKLDQDKSTVNQMPSDKSSEGAGAGGVSGETDNWPAKSDLYSAPAEKGSAVDKPADSVTEGAGAGKVDKKPDRYDRFDYGY